MNLTSPPSAAAFYGPRAALFWAATHARRSLRRRGFRVAFAMFGIGLPVLQLMANQSGAVGLPAALLGLVPLVSLFAGAGALRNEIEDQTLTYAFTRPLSRAWIYRALVFSAMLPACLIALPACFAVAYRTDPSQLGSVMLAAGLSILSYTSLFALIGQFAKRATALGCVYLFFWEGMVSNVPGFLGDLTIVAHVRAVAGLPRTALPLPAELLSPSSPMGSAITLAVVTAVALYLGGLLIERREYILGR
jgi:hypothetical protein